MIATEIKDLQVKETVELLLQFHPKYRDCDKMLSARIWTEQIGGYEHLEKMTAKEFLNSYVNGGILYSQESIGRVRRKLQEENQNLRGLKYKDKQEQQNQVKNELGYSHTVNNKSE